MLRIFSPPKSHLSLLHLGQAKPFFRHSGSRNRSYWYGINYGSQERGHELFQPDHSIARGSRKPHAHFSTSLHSPGKRASRSERKRTRRTVNMRFPRPWLQATQYALLGHPTFPGFPVAHPITASENSLCTYWPPVCAPCEPNCSPIAGRCRMILGEGFK
jgi:hypothetical protein